ncbi:MAG TPA: hypothetical protein VJ840_16405 [Gemmatimonadaceae bacterium]|nr:hypothetical protein [Gemmatimonadaceae bacterium]
MKKKFVIAFVAVCSGCYQYAAFQPTPTTVGKVVRVQLTDAGTARIAPLVGPGAGYVEGNLSSLTDSSYSIALAALGRRNGTEEAWKGEQVTLSHSDVGSIQLRKASAGKSAALTAALVSGAALVARAIGAGEGAARTKTGGSSSGQ